jgi:predicted enzyme related to lactoylglutathione lyase
VLIARDWAGWQAMAAPLVPICWPAVGPDLSSPRIEMWAFPMSMDAPGCAGALVQMPGMPSGGNSTLVYFSCEDCATEGGRVNGAGGKVQREKMPIGEYGHIVLAHDTEGNMFGLHSMK